MKSRFARWFIIAFLALGLLCLTGLLTGCRLYEGIRQSQGKEPFSSPFTRHLKD